MLETKYPDQLEKIRRQAVENSIWVPEDASEDLRRARSAHTQYRFLLNKITEAAKQEALNRNLSADDFEYGILSEAADIIRDVQFALVSDPQQDHRKSWNFWRHVDDPLYRIRKKDVPYFNRPELESAATRYLNSPLRAQAVDRMFVDSLVAAEVFAFGDEMLNPYFRSMSPLKQSPALWAYVKGQFWTAVFFGGISALALWLQNRGVIGDGFTVWTVGISAALFILFLVISTISLPFAWRQQSKSRQTVVQLLQAMINVYSELRSDGAISAHHVRHVAQKAAMAGVKWPATLFALLDDIIARNARF